MAATPPPDFTSAGFNSSVTALVQDKTYNWIGDINASFVLQSGYLVFMSEPLSLPYKGWYWKCIVHSCSASSQHLGGAFFPWCSRVTSSDKCCSALQCSLGSLW